MRKRIAMLLLVCLSVQGAGTALAVGLRRHNHASRFNFVFGNPIDMHQQPKPVGNTALEEFFFSKGIRCARVRLTIDTWTNGALYETADWRKPWDIGVTTDPAIQGRIVCTTTGSQACLVAVP